MSRVSVKLFEPFTCYLYHDSQSFFLPLDSITQIHCGNVLNIWGNHFSNNLRFVFVPCMLWEGTSTIKAQSVNALNTFVCCNEVVLSSKCSQWRNWGSCCTIILFLKDETVNRLSQSRRIWGLFSTNFHKRNDEV